MEMMKKMLAGLLALSLIIPVLPGTAAGFTAKAATRFMEQC